LWRRLGIDDVVKAAVDGKHDPLDDDVGIIKPVFAAPVTLIVGS